MKLAQKYRLNFKAQKELSAAVNRALGTQFANADEMFETLFSEVRRMAALLIRSEADGSTSLISNQVVREIPTGVINGSNTTFTLTTLPVAGSEEVFLNGLLQDARGIDYSISGAAVTFLSPPLPGDRVLVTYERA